MTHQQQTGGLKSAAESLTAQFPVSRPLVPLFQGGASATGILLIGLSLSGCGGKNPLVLPESAADLLIQPFPKDNEGAEYFDRFLTTFGVYVLVADQVSETDAFHATHVLAQYLDNDEDGVPDNPTVIEALVNANATMIVFETEEDLRRSGIFRGATLDGINAQDLYGAEILPPGEFDATLEEVLHLVTHVGYAQAFPEDYSEDGPSTLTNAMDIARGGHFETVPNSYPEQGWYHYDDTTCDYNCMATEYLYWSISSLLGAQTDRCEHIAQEWELCTPDLMETTDTAIIELLRNGPVQTPSLLPDGSYRK